MLSQFVVKPLVVTDGTATTTDAATVYITGAMTGVTVTGRNDALRVDGQTSLNGTVYCSSDVFTGNFMTNQVSTSANLAVWASTTVSTSNTNLQFAGSSNVAARVWERGGSSPAIPAGYAYGSHIIGVQNVNMASSGTHPMFSQLVIKGMSVTAAAGNIADAATVYIEGVLANKTPTGRNDALRVNGTVYFMEDMEYAATKATIVVDTVTGTRYRLTVANGVVTPIAA
jgi:hypothetical protein